MAQVSRSLLGPTAHPATLCFGALPEHFPARNLNEAHSGKVRPRKCLPWALTLLALVTVIPRALNHIKKAGLLA